MKVLRTPESNFASLADYPFEPSYTTVRTADGDDLRIHHLDEGPDDGPLVLCMHGQPTWSYLYRKMIPPLVGEGMRVVAPDLPGYGKSDKPAAREDYSYQRQVDWMGNWLERNDFSGITLFAQDWGGLIGLRLVADHADRFDRVVVSNTGLPYSPDVSDEVVREVERFREEAPTPTMGEVAKALSGKMEAHPALSFARWQKFCWETEDLPIGLMMSAATASAEAYDAPFPDPSYKMGPRAMPSCVPTLPTDSSHEAQRDAWEFFAGFDKPFLCAFTDDDPITSGADAQFKARVPGAKGIPHRTIEGGGHFVQEGRPVQAAQAIVSLVRTA